MNRKIFFKDNQSGSLLINVLVAIGITVLLTTVSIPYIKKFQPSLKLNATARELTANLRWAQQLTVTEQVIHKVRFNLITDSYDILKVDMATTTIKSVVFDSDVSFQDVGSFTDDTVVFNYYGGVSEADTIILLNINAKTAEIEIKPSGYVHLGL